ncbi:IclR family transcriptional regulator [Billgrantia diversa]|uniref:IclR family transcriptional regulator n=1 Tax=Halomonas sp. MCCC 1A13316 TaxID=2733487 RepID=UPI0018A41FA4|nr:IclR family transcriptional regulator [Halomonas sp. MCCC 1A13316]QOR37725.1 IclR family transcriptional regulator [Halomonas sp. MCCC 1A13316]
MPREDRQLVDALARGFAILECLSRARKPLGNGEISTIVDLPPSTVSRLTHSLTVLGYIRRSPSQRTYELTPKNLILGYPVLAGMSLLDRARPYLKSISEQTGETVTLAVRDGLYSTFMEVVQGVNLVAVRLATGGRLRLAVSASGIAMVASLPEKEKRSVATRIRADIARRGEDPTVFNSALEECEATDVAVVRNTWQKGIGGVAVALQIQGELAALTIPVATGSVGEESMRSTLTDALQEAAAAISPSYDSQPG